MGYSKELTFSKAVDEILYQYFYLTKDYAGFVQPFKSAKRWVRPRYGSTALQRITTDTFGSVFLSTKRGVPVGLADGSLKQLAGHLDGRLVPAFDLAVRLYFGKTEVRRATQTRTGWTTRFEVSGGEEESLLPPGLRNNPRSGSRLSRSPGRSSFPRRATARKATGRRSSASLS